MCRRNDFTSMTTQLVLFQSCFRWCCHRKLASSCSRAVNSGTCDSWLWDVPKIQILAAQPRTAWTLAGLLCFFFFWISMQKAHVVSGWECGQPGFAPYCSKVCWDRWTLRCVWTETCSSKGFRIALRVLIFT